MWEPAEDAAFGAGYTVVGGLDEAGRGPLAGPVVAACVVLPEGVVPDGVADSKSLTPAARSRVFAVIRKVAIGTGIGVATAAEIDSTNILRATHLAMRRAVEACTVRPSFVLVDGLPVPSLPVPHRAIVRGDARCVSIAAASIVAKVTRDAIMDELDARYPGYGFAENKGYGTRAHQTALSQMGPCPEHRQSFRPVRDCLAGRSLLRADGPTKATEGNRGEMVARQYLERLGHRILAMHYRAGRAEIDIVSQEGETIVFTEVKTSRLRGQEHPAIRLREPQQLRIAMAAAAFLAERGIPDAPCRLDVIEVILTRPAPTLRHHRAAFDVRR